MPGLLSHYRPDQSIYMFTDDPAVQRRMSMYHGVTPLHIQFKGSADETFEQCALSWHAGSHAVRCCTCHPMPD